MSANRNRYLGSMSKRRIGVEIIRTGTPRDTGKSFMAITSIALLLCIRKGHEKQQLRHRLGMVFDVDRQCCPEVPKKEWYHS